MALGFTFHQSYFPSFNSAALASTVETGYIATTISPLFYKHVVVEFSVPVEWGNCLFDIYRSETDLGPWRRLTPSPIAGPFFKDKETKDYSKFMTGWYKVECRLPDGRRIQGPATTWETKRKSWVELRAKEVERRERLLLEKFVGVSTLLFRRKTFGQRCPNCWNPKIEKVTQDHCKVCLGTSFNGGYFEGIETLVQYEATPNDANLSYQGRVEVNTIQAWTISYPQINLFDIVLRMPDLKVYRVEKLMDTELQTKSVRQIMQITELDKEDIEYELTHQALPSSYL